jgi:predicted dehydrogenase
MTNVAFYGAGERAQPYLAALAQRSDVQVTALCDVDRRAAEQSAVGWGARVYLSYEAMLQEARPDVLWVCVAPHLQGDVLLRAVEQSIPFFVEPPGAMNFERACLYAQRVAAAKLVTAVGFATRYTDVLQEAREYLGTNPLPLILGWWLRPGSDETVTTAAELLWCEACRQVDIMRYYCGEVSRVQALSAGIPPAKDTAGGVVVQLELSSGSVGVLTCAVFARPEPRVELELVGEGWSLSFAERLSSLRLVERDKTTILRSLNDPAKDQVAAFLDAIAGGKPTAVASGYADALRTLAVCQAAQLSAREGRAVALAEVLPG